MKLPGGLRLPGMADASRNPNGAAAAGATATAGPIRTFGQEPVSAAALTAAFEALANGFRAENRINEYTLLNRAFEFDPATLDVRLPVDNKVQLGRFGELKPDLLIRLRTALRNGRLTLSAYLTQRPQERRLYTDSDKLAYLTQKHPALAELRERLHLEPNF
ncbi:MAG: hypothetical protein H7330_07460 [Hymenobacteraceae bacterium]|nr:hypothetical protein [Hymenobacteraceae bacterium]